MSKKSFCIIYMALVYGKKVRERGNVMKVGDYVKALFPFSNGNYVRGRVIEVEDGFVWVAASNFITGPFRFRAEELEKINNNV